MSRIGNNIFSLLEGVECDPSKVIENANLVHKASPAPAPSKKEKIAQKAVSKNEAALDLQQHLLYPSQNRLRNLRRERQGNNNGYVSNGRRQESSKGSQEKDGELNNNHNINGGRYYEHRNGYQGGSRVGYNYNNQYRKNNNYKNGRGYNNSGQEEDCRNQLPEVVDQGSASNVGDDSWQEVGSRRNVHKQARVYNSGYRRRRYHNGWQNRENHSNKNGSESTERNDTNGVDGSEVAISAAADIDRDDLHGSEKSPLIDAAAAADIVDAKSEIGSATADSTSEVTQGDGGATAAGSEESAEKKSEGEENKNKKKKKKRNNKNKKNNNGDQFDKEKEAQSRVDDRKLMTLKEYEKLQLQKKEALEALKSGEARQVRVDKDLESMQLVEKKRKEESDASKKKEEAEKKKASSSPVIKKKGIDEFVKPKTWAAGRPNGGGNYQNQDRRNYGDGERFNNQSRAGRGRGNYQHQRENYGDEKVFNGRRGSGSVRGRGNGGVNYNNSSSSAGGDGAAAVTAGDVYAAGGGAAKGGPEFAIDPKQFPELLREK